MILSFVQRFALVLGRWVLEEVLRKVWTTIVRHLEELFQAPLALEA